MPKRKRPVLVATRVTSRERAAIDAAAELADVPVSTLLRIIILPAVAQRLSESAAELTRSEAA
jgi:hypothetical protein